MNGLTQYMKWKLILKVAGIVISGYLLHESKIKTERDFDRLYEYQNELRYVLSEQNTVIEDLVVQQNQLQIAIAELRDPRPVRRTPQPESEPGNDLTETIDYVAKTPKRIGREAERFLDKINPF